MYFAFQDPLVPVDTDILILEATLVLEVLLDRYVICAICKHIEMNNDST